MTHYAFHDLTLEVRRVEEESGRDLDQLLDDLSWVKTRAFAGAASLSLSVHLNGGAVSLPPTAREVLRADGLLGFETGSDFYLTDGSSLFYLEPEKGRGEARLAPSFFLKPPPLREKFWTFGLLKLLRPMGIYALHAAGLVSKRGLGVLVVGESGSGKSTLTIGLIRAGWRYLSDEVVLLRSRPEGVEALALRKHFYVDGAAAGAYADLPLGEERPDRSGGVRKRVAVEEAYPTQRVAACTPGLLLFPRIVQQPRSVLVPIDRASGLGRLIAQSGSQLFDRDTMPGHLTLLKALLQQTTSYELHAGSDLYQNPVTLVDLLAAEEKEALCPVLS